MREAIAEGNEIEILGMRRELGIECLHVDDLHEDNDIDWMYVDDNTGLALDPECVEIARADEMKRVGKIGVYVYVRREEAKRNPLAKWVE